MQEATPALFTVDSSQSPQGVVLMAGANELAMDPQEGVASRPAKKGEDISVFANGLGEVDGAIVTGSPAPLDRFFRLKNKVRVFIGGVAVEPAFAGLAPGAVGVYQINAKVPESAPSGSAVPLHIEMVLSDGRSVKSNQVTLAIDGSSGVD
jgi:uncharacterized protein (TIGR03437 family)